MTELTDAVHTSGVLGALAVGCHCPGEGLTFATQAGDGADALQVDNVVCIASAGKQMTAACVGMLVVDGVLDVDCPVREYIPELPAWADGIRLRHLVHHLGGWPDTFVHQLAFSGAVPVWTNDSVLELVCTLPGLQDEPGTVFSYSSVGYICLAIAAERAAGEPMSAMGKRRLFAPLGMTSTRFWTGPGVHPPTVTTHPAWYPGLPNAQTVGDGGVWSSVRDLTRWNEAMTAGAFGGEVANLLRTPGRLNDGTLVDYAWGAFISRGPNGNAYSHGGWWPGCATFLIQVPALRRSAALVAFTDDAQPVEALGHRLVGV